MPELPEVETIMRGLASIMVKSHISTVILNRANLRKDFPKNLKEILENSQIQRLRRRAKYLLCDIKSKYSENWTILFHLGMSGRLLIDYPIYREDSSFHYQNNYKHNHFVLFFDTQEQKNIRLSYVDPRRFGVIDLYKTENEALYSSFKNIGIEPLNKQELTYDYLSKKLSQTKSPIKNFLLNQKYIVGLGNIYVCEILFRAKIHPQRASSSLTINEKKTLLKFIPDILNQAIGAGGSTLRDYVQSDGEKGGFQELHQVYGREGEACPACKTGKCQGITRIIQAGRSTFFCPSQQKYKEN